MVEWQRNFMIKVIFPERYTKKFLVAALHQKYQSFFIVKKTGQKTKYKVRVTYYPVYPGDEENAVISFDLYTHDRKYGWSYEYSHKAYYVFHDKKYGGRH